MAKTTPMRAQYLEIKSQFPNAIVFFRLGDFYETFDDDAKIVAGELDIVLTSRNVSKNKRIPMAGVPHHAAENYVARLIDKGYHVAICDQVGDETVGGLMPREVVRVVTPGTVSEPALLPEKQNNYLAAIAVTYRHDSPYPDGAGFAYADISTGEFATTEFSGDDVIGLIQQEMARLSPRECLLAEHIAEDGRFPLNNGTHITPYESWRFDPTTAKAALQRHFDVKSLQAFGLDGKDLATSAAGAVLQYLQETQLDGLAQVRTLIAYTTGDYMVLDAATRRNLELTETIRGRTKQGALLGTLDQTTTNMGGRLLRRWISRPLLDLDRLTARHDLVESLYVDGHLRAQVVAALGDIADLERLANRVLSGKILPREVVSLRESLNVVPALRGLLISNEQALRDLAHRLDPVEEAADLIASAIDEETPATLNTTGVIRAGYSPELDRVVNASASARDYINSLEAVEREATGIKKLKVSYNKVFGYYIEVSKVHSDSVPEHYVRKQTLVNAERYITPEMKEVEVKLLNAEEEISRHRTPTLSGTFARTGDIH